MTTKLFEYTTENFTIRLELRDYITFIVGESATGKTYMGRCLEMLSVFHPEILSLKTHHLDVLKSKFKSGMLVLLDMTEMLSDAEAFQLSEWIRKNYTKGYFIIMDRAGLYLSREIGLLADMSVNYANGHTTFGIVYRED